MDKYQKLAEALRSHHPGKTIVLFNAVVKSMEGESCTVDVDGLEIDEVRLKATINGESNKMIVEPKIGSSVLVGSLTGDLKDLAIIKVDEVAKLHYEQDGLEILIDSTDQKIKIANSEVSLHDLLVSLTDLLKELKVFTPVGVSGTPIPTTITAIEAFETGFKKILK